MTVPLQVTAFKGDKTRNLLDLSYQIVPPATGWPGNNVPVSIPPFNIDLYAVPKGSLSDARNPANLVGCYAVTNPAVLKGTAASNQFVVTLDPGVINSTLLQTLYSNGSHYLVAELDFAGGSRSLFASREATSRRATARYIPSAGRRSPSTRPTRRIIRTVPRSPRQPEPSLPAGQSRMSAGI